jgi:hypothetical protein
MTELQEELSDVIEEAISEYVDRHGELTIGTEATARVAAKAVEEWLIDRGLA